MKNLVSFIFLLALLVSGCSQEEVLKNGTASVSGQGRIFTTGFEQNGSRTYLEDGLYSCWTEGDLIALFDGNTLKRQYRFDGKTGDKSGTFSIVDNANGTGSLLSANYAVYPYASDVEISDGGVITITLPAEQSYASDSYGLGANMMVAVTHNIYDTFLKFRSVGGCLKFQLCGDDIALKTITLKGNDNEKLAGKAYITAAYDKAPTLSMADDATSSVTLDCGEGVVLDKETPVVFMMMIPPTTFEKGITVTMEDINGKVYTQSTFNQLVVDRNIIKPMAAVEVKDESLEGFYKDGVVRLAESGTMKELLGDDFLHITSLKVVGPIDGDDVYVLRQMLGGHEFSKSVWGKLSALDLSEATIVAGGRDYYKDRFGSYSTSDNVVGEMMFYQCAVLQNMVLPANAVSIADGAFYGCTAMTSVTIGEAVLSIGASAFDSCLALASIDLPDGLTSIGNGAFSMCQSLTSVTIPKGITRIRQYTFSTCLLLNSVTIPDGVTSIDTRAFSRCYALTSVKLPSSLKSMGDAAFEYCTGLTSITIPDGVKEIPTEAFYGCEAMATVTIPKSVYHIGRRAFVLCPSLKEVYCYAIDPPYIMDEYGGNKAFNSYDENTTLYVPAEATCYDVSDWALFFPKIGYTL